jgi:SCP-2 sterol transfer family protein
MARTFAEFVVALIDALERAEPVLAKRLRELVGRRVARMALDGELIDVLYRRGRLVVTAAGATQRKPDGLGSTDRATAAALLDSRVEVQTAILDGRLELRGDIDAISRIGVAIEILLEASARVPELRALAEEFRAGAGIGGAAAEARHDTTELEIELLARLRLLTEDAK